MVNVISERATAKDVLGIFDVSRESSDKLQIYADLLVKWQKKINLIGPAESQRIWSRHIADGLQLIEHIPTGARNIIDLGTGAGLPGIVLAILLAEKGAKLHLVESNGKKAAFLREVTRVLKLPVNVCCQRIESSYQAEWVQEIDVVCARALAPLPALLNLSAPFLEKHGEMLFLKGLDVDNELTKTTKYWNMKVHKYPSRTHANGCVLKIKEFQRVQFTSRQDSI